MEINCYSEEKRRLIFFNEDYQQKQQNQSKVEFAHIGMG